ncbi:hypothetical protein UCREL1_10055 [Eutypa lata UCREL1]|uniref:Uncharacterized protein n=1 Tax=Eutypa lata (strain UCR-EL1) TaxID=1287681 RepID=M7SZJ6_EUTLA|nr:hypothetical protein UCREL1_10055 [Eutypa lata UCREL1]
MSIIETIVWPFLTSVAKYHVWLALCFALGLCIYGSLTETHPLYGRLAFSALLDLYLFKVSTILGLVFFGLVWFVMVVLHDLAFRLAVLWFAVFFLLTRVKAWAAVLFIWGSGHIFNYYVYGPWYLVGYLPMTILFAFLWQDVVYEITYMVPLKYPAHLYPVWPLLSRCLSDALSNLDWVGPLTSIPATLVPLITAAASSIIGSPTIPPATLRLFRSKLACRCLVGRAPITNPVPVLLPRLLLLPRSAYAEWVIRRWERRSRSTSPSSLLVLRLRLSLPPWSFRFPRDFHLANLRRRLRVASASYPKGLMAGTLTPRVFWLMTSSVILGRSKGETSARGRATAQPPPVVSSVPPVTPAPGPRPVARSPSSVAPKRYVKGPRNEDMDRILQDIRRNGTRRRWGFPITDDEITLLPSLPPSPPPSPAPAPQVCESATPDFATEPVQLPEPVVPSSVVEPEAAPLAIPAEPATEFPQATPGGSWFPALATGPCMESPNPSALVGTAPAEVDNSAREEPEPSTSAVEEFSGHGSAHDDNMSDVASEHSNGSEMSVQYPDTVAAESSASAAGSASNAAPPPAEDGDIVITDRPPWKLENMSALLEAISSINVNDPSPNPVSESAPPSPSSDVFMPPTPVSQLVAVPALAESPLAPSPDLSFRASVAGPPPSAPQPQPPAQSVFGGSEAAPVAQTTDSDFSPSVAGPPSSGPQTPAQYVFGGPEAAPVAPTTGSGFTFSLSHAPKYTFQTPTPQPQTPSVASSPTEDEDSTIADMENQISGGEGVTFEDVPIPEPATSSMAADAVAAVAFQAVSLTFEVPPPSTPPVLSSLPPTPTSVPLTSIPGLTLFNASLASSSASQEAKGKEKAVEETTDDEVGDTSLQEGSVGEVAARKAAIAKTKTRHFLKGCARLDRERAKAKAEQGKAKAREDSV